MSLLLSMFIAAAGTSWANGRFVDNLDGTVTDTQTGLMWQQADDGVLRKWDKAVAYCESLELPSPGGHSDWRAPRIDELQTIISYATFSPAGFDPPLYGPFSTRSSYYWSASTHAHYPVVVWVVDFYDGYAVWGYKTFSYYVRCVRGGDLGPWSF